MPVLGMEWKPVVVRYLIDQHRENLANFNDPSAKTAKYGRKLQIKFLNGSQEFLWKELRFFLFS